MIYGCSEPKARRPISVRTHTTLASTADNLRALNEIENKKIENYIAADSLHTYVNSQNGFWYRIIDKSTNNRFPKFGETVVYNLEIQDLNNQIIYSEEEIGTQSYRVDKQDLITGLQKGIKLMNEGDKAKFLIPAYSAYGIIGDQKRIGNNQSIITIVTLKSIK